MADKKVPAAEILAEAWRKSPGFGAPHWHEKRWVWLSPNGDARTKCGSPIRPPKAEDVKPHEQQLWDKCWKCNTIRPWGGCGSKSHQPTWASSRMVDVDRTPTEKPEPELTEVDSPAALLVVLEKMTESGTFGNWLIEDEIVVVAAKHFNFKVNAASLLDLLRPLWHEGKIEHQRNRFGQNCFHLKGE